VAWDTRQRTAGGRAAAIRAPDLGRRAFPGVLHPRERQVRSVGAVFRRESEREQSAIEFVVQRIQRRAALVDAHPDDSWRPTRWKGAALASGQVEGGDRNLGSKRVEHSGCSIVGDVTDETYGQVHVFGRDPSGPHRVRQTAPQLANRPRDRRSDLFVDLDRHEHSHRRQLTPALKAGSRSWQPESRQPKAGSRKLEAGSWQPASAT
jgi:hypothetical protein